MLWGISAIGYNIFTALFCFVVGFIRNTAFVRLLRGGFREANIYRANSGFGLV